MAYRRKRSKMASRSSYRRRYSRRRRYRRYNSRRTYRRYRRFPKHSECKTIVKAVSYYWAFDNPTLVTESTVQFAPMRVFVLPGISQNYANAVAPLNQSLTNSGRIGAKVSPVKLRITGSMSYSPPNYIEDEPTRTMQILPGAFHLRLVVMQLKGCKTDLTTSFDEDYHPLIIPPFTTNEFNGDKSKSCVNGKGVAKIFGRYKFTEGGDHTRFSSDDMCFNMSAGVTPFRQGIGGQMRMLYTRTFRIDSGTHNSIPFRIVTKVPRPFVWPEKVDGFMDVETQSLCRNPVVIYWLLVPQTNLPHGRVYLNQQIECFFTDK